MFPKSKSTSGSESTPKRQKRVMRLANKIKVLDMLVRGDSAVSVGKHFNVNESTIRSIKKNEENIRKSVSRSSETGNKITGRVRDENLEKELALSIWIEDQTQKKNPLSTLIIKSKALKLFEYFKVDSTSTTSTFVASKG